MSDTPTHPLFLALNAAVEHVRTGELNEAEVCHEWCDGDRQETLTVTVRRFADEHVRLALEADEDGE